MKFLRENVATPFPAPYYSRSYCNCYFVIFVFVTLLLPVPLLGDAFPFNGLLLPLSIMFGLAARCAVV